MKGLYPFQPKGFLGDYDQATTVTEFWGKWNPIVRNVQFGLLRFLVRWIGSRWAVIPALFFTFGLTGFGHDLITLALTLGRRGLGFFGTIFFLLNAIVIVVERKVKKRLLRLSVWKRRTIMIVLLNLSWIIASFLATLIGYK